MRFSILGGLLLAPLLYSNSLTLEGVWNGGGKEVYTYGNEKYCLKPNDGSSVTITNDADSRFLRSCIYLTYGGVLAEDCGRNPSLTINNLSEKIYNVVLAPEEAETNQAYTLEVTYDGAFGRCAEYYEAGFLGMSIEQLNFLYGLVAAINVSILFGAIIYVILTLGNF